MLSKYNPMSKEFQKEIKRLGLTGNQFCLAIDKGCENQAELQKLQSWNRGYTSPMFENEDCKEDIVIL